MFSVTNGPIFSEAVAMVESGKDIYEVVEDMSAFYDMDVTEESDMIIALHQTFVG